MMPLRVGPWHVAICVILLCAGAVSALYYVRIHATNSVERLLSRFPEGEASYLYLDFAALKASGMFELLARTDPPPETEYREFVAESGFDYRNDLDAVLGSFRQSETYFLARGRFDWGKLMRSVKNRGGDCYNGVCRTTASMPNRWISFFAVTPSIMAMAVSRDAWAVDSLLEERSAPAINDFPQQPFWLILSGPALTRMSNLPAGTQGLVSALSDAKRITVAMGASGVTNEAKLRVDCRSENEAAVLSKQLQSVTELVRKMIRLEKKAPSVRDASGVLAGGTFQSSQMQVHGTWPIPREFLEALFGGGVK